MKEWGVIKRIALLMVVAALGFAMVACQGAVGPTGDEGDQGDQGDAGETGESGGVAPALTGDGVRAHRGYTLEVRDDTHNWYQVDLWFSDPDATAETAPLQISASSSNEEVATAELVQVQVTEDGETSTYTHLYVTAVASGRANVTVTATDPDDLSASVVLRLFVEAAEETGEEGEEDIAAVGTIDDVTVDVGATTDVDVADNFSGDGLTYSAESSDTDVATVVVEGSVVTVTGVADGTATITVTATDADDETAEQSFDVTVGEGDPEEVTDVSSDCDTLDVGDTCKVMAPDGNTVKSGNSNLLTVTKKDGYWEVLAIAKGMTTVEVRDTNTNALVETIDVKINNRAPKRKGTNPGLVQLSAVAATTAPPADLETPTYPDDGKDPLFDDGDGDPIFVNSADEPLYKIQIPGATPSDLNLDDYFTDPDGDDVRFTATSSHPERAIVVGFNEVADGTTEVLVDVLHNIGNVVTFTFSATDNDSMENRMTSDSENLLLLEVELRPVFSWRYDVGQYRTAQGVDFISPKDVDYRRNDPDNNNDPTGGRAGWHHLDFTRDGATGDVGFQFAEDVGGDANHANMCTAAFVAAVTQGTAASCYEISLSNATTIKLGDLIHVAADGVHTIPFQVLSAGNVTITVGYKYWDGETPQELHEDSRDLSLRVNEVDEP